MGKIVLATINIFLHVELSFMIFWLRSSLFVCCIKLFCLFVDDRNVPEEYSSDCIYAVDFKAVMTIIATFKSTLLIQYRVFF